MQMRRHRGKRRGDGTGGGGGEPGKERVQENRGRGWMP